MSNPQQNGIQNGIEQINREIKICCRINLRKTKKKRNQFQNGLKEVKKNTNQKRQNRLKRIVKNAEFFSNQKNTKNIAEYIAK